MSPAESVSTLSRSCRQISTNSSHRARTLSRLHSGCARKQRAKHFAFASAGLNQKSFSLQALVRQASAAKQAALKSSNRRLRGQVRQAHSEEASDASAINEANLKKLEQLSVSSVRRSRFSERLQDAQRIEDLFELVRDAERLTASEVAQLPLALARLYEQRTVKEQQALVAQPFFEALVKPWALEPSRLAVQEQLATLQALIQIHEWNTTAGPALTKAIFLLAHAVKNSLSSVPHQFTPAELLQLLTSCNKKAMLREACATLPLACLTACTIQLDSLSPDQIAQAAFLGVQTRLRLNVSGAAQMRTLVKAGIGQAADMSALCITQLMFAAVSIGGTKPAKLQDLAVAALRVVPQCDAAALKNLMWAVGTAELYDEKLLVAVEARLKSVNSELGVNHSPSLDLLRELANQAMIKSAGLTVPHSRRLLWGFYTLRFYPPEALVEAIAKHIEPAVSSMDPYDLSNFIWAFGGFGYQPSNMQLFLQAAQDCSYKMNSHDVSQTIRGLANLRLSSGQLGQDLLQRAYAVLDTFNTQALANLAWSMAHLGFKHSNLLDRTISQLAWNVDEVNQRDLAEVLSALALLNHEPEADAMDEMLHQLTKLLQDSDVKWQQQDLSTILWSLAKMNAGTRRLIDLMFNHIVVDVPSLSAKDISYQLWSFVVLGFPLPYQVVKAYEDRLLIVVDDIDPVDLSHVMWAVARLDKYPSPALLDALLATLPPQMDDAEPTAVATTVHACGQLRHHPDEAFLEAVEQHAHTFSQEYTCANWSALLQTFTRLQAPSKRLYSALLQQAQSGDLEVDSRLLGDILMSVAVSKAWQEPIYTHMLQQARSLAQTSFRPKALHQLYQVNLLAQATGVAAALDLSESFKSQEQQRWLQSQLPFNTTRLVQDLCATLDVLRIPYRRGPPAGPALMTIDIALVDRKVAIEALGPLKVLKNKQSITGQAAHRQNLLSALGWTVVPVKETDWLNLKTPADKEWRLWQLLP